MSPRGRPRLDPAPVQKWMKIYGLSSADVARTAGVKHRTVQSWLLRKSASGGNRPGLTLNMAETLSMALGFHPVELWGDDYIDAVLWEPKLSMTRKAVWQRERRRRASHSA